MRKLIVLTAVMFAAAFVARVALAEDKEATKSGVLIDTKCGMKMTEKSDPEAAAKEHKKACAVKCGADGGFGLISGKDLVKFDDNGNKLAKEYLAKEDSKTEVEVKGKEKDDGTFAVTSIDAKK